LTRRCRTTGSTWSLSIRTSTAASNQFGILARTPRHSGWRRRWKPVRA
jgi:hypothetical protein